MVASYDHQYDLESKPNSQILHLGLTARDTNSPFLFMVGVLI